MDAVKYFFIALSEFTGIFVELGALDIRGRHAVKFTVHNDMIPAFAAGDILFFNSHRVNYGFCNLGFPLALHNKAAKVYHYFCSQ